MTNPTFELVKVAALGALVGLIFALFLPALYATIVGMATFWLLLARIT